MSPKEFLSTDRISEASFVAGCETIVLLHSDREILDFCFDVSWVNLRGSFRV